MNFLLMGGGFGRRGGPDRAGPAAAAVLAADGGTHARAGTAGTRAVTVGVVCAVPGIWAGGYDFGAPAWGAAVFTGLFATAAAFFCMVAGQRAVPASRAALVLLVEPVSAGILGLATGEDLGARGLLGAAVILAAIAWVELVPLLTGARTDDPAIEPTVHG